MCALIDIHIHVHFDVYMGKFMHVCDFIDVSIVVRIGQRTAGKCGPRAAETGRKRTGARGASWKTVKAPTVHGTGVSLELVRPDKG